MYKKIRPALLLGVMLTFSTGARAADAVSETWKLTHNMISSFANTAYFAAMNSIIKIRTWPSGRLIKESLLMLFGHLSFTGSRIIMKALICLNDKGVFRQKK